MSPILVLLDMNGTVCYRAEEPVPGARADLYVRRKYYYKRAGIAQFVKALVDSGLFCVAVYTSMMRHNVEAGLDAILPGHKTLLLAVLDRTMNKPDPEGTEEWDTIRDMDKVWRALRGYGPHNTILLDNEARKFKEHPQNGIVVPEFGTTEVRSRSPDTLSELKAYLLELGGAAPDDIRDYLCDHPFSVGYTRRAAVGLERRPAPPPPLRAASAAAAVEEGAGSELADLVAGLSLSPSGGQGRRQGAARLPDVPAGTSLRLVCVDDDGWFVMKTAGGSKGLTVRGRVTPGLRVELRMDYHLLVHDAAAVGAELRVEQEEEQQ